MEWKSSVRILDKNSGKVVKEFESISKLIKFIEDNKYSKGSTSTIKSEILRVLKGKPQKDGKGNFYIPQSTYGFRMEYIKKATKNNDMEMEFIKYIGKEKEYLDFLNKKEK